MPSSPMAPPPFLNIWPAVFFIMWPNSAKRYFPAWVVEEDSELVQKALAGEEGQPPPPVSTTTSARPRWPIFTVVEVASPMMTKSGLARRLISREETPSKHDSGADRHQVLPLPRGLRGALPVPGHL